MTIEKVNCDKNMSIELKEYLAQQENTRCSYFISNTVNLKNATANVVFSDLYNKHGKYVFISRQFFTHTQNIHLGIGISHRVLLSN